jgi:hypothetical protein
MPHKLKYTNQQLIKEAQTIYQRFNRVPRLTDFPPGKRAKIYIRFGTWRMFLLQAIGKEPVLKYWSKEDLVKFAREFYSRHHRFPLNEETVYEGRNIRNNILHRFHSANEWLEESIGTSPRVEILRAIAELTPPGCETATPREILAHIRTKMDFPTNLMSFNTAGLSEATYITGGRLDRTSWWKMTNAGRKFLKGFKKCVMK